MIKYMLCVLLIIIGLTSFALSINKKSSKQFSLKQFLLGRKGNMDSSKETAIANGITYTALGIICAILFYLFDNFK